MSSGKFLYFDFETNWQIRECENIQLDFTQFENELLVTPFHSNSMPSANTSIRS
jgi:hypothetical protein